MKKISFIILLMFTSFIIGQNNFDAVKSIQDAEKFITNNPQINAKLYTKYISVDSLKFSLDTISEKSKIIESNKVPFYRVSYIYLDGEKLKLDKIKKIQLKIRSDFNKGMSFVKLNKKYSMDGNVSKGGDLGWFAENQMVEEFVSGIKNKLKGDIFSLDIPSLNWYYVVLKTHSNKEMIELKILTVEE